MLLQNYKFTVSIDSRDRNLILPCSIYAVSKGSLTPLMIHITLQMSSGQQEPTSPLLLIMQSIHCQGKGLAIIANKLLQFRLTNESSGTDSVSLLVIQYYLTSLLGYTDADAASDDSYSLVQCHVCGWV